MDRFRIHIRLMIPVAAAVLIAALAPRPSVRGQTPDLTPPQLPVYADHAALMQVYDGARQLVPIKTRADGDVRRAHTLAHMQSVMGPLPGGERRTPLDMQILETHEEPDYTRYKITYASEPGDRVPAWLLIPKGKRGPFPAMLALHQTTRMGKDEPIGLGLKNLAYGRELAQRGFVVLAPDYPNFGEHRTDAYALGYASASMKAIWDNCRGVDLLLSLQKAEVRPDQIGVIGHSLGGHNALFTAAFEPRLSAVVTSCGFTSFPKYYGGKLAGWSHSGYMPRIASQYGLNPAAVPFDFPEILGAVAPRALFVNAPMRDDNFDQGGVKDCLAAVAPVYALWGQPERVRAVHPDSAHDFPPEERLAAYKFLDQIWNMPAVTTATQPK